MYEAAHTAVVDSDTILELMGFKGASGPSRAALASLKQFGLIEGRDQALKVTLLALSIFQPLNDAEKGAAVRTAFSSPSLYGELLAKFEGKIPPENVVKSFLIRNYGFGASGAENFSRVFRENLNFVERYSGSTERLPVTESTPEILRRAVDSNDTARLSEGPRSKFVGGEGENESLQFRLNAQSVATVLISGDVTKAAIDRLVAFLTLARESYPDGDL